MSNTIHRLAKARPNDRAAWARRIACEVRELTAELGGIGWRFADIAVSLDVSERSLNNYRNGADEPKARVMDALRALVAEHCKKAVGQ